MKQNLYLVLPKGVDIAKIARRYGIHLRNRVRNHVTLVLASDLEQGLATQPAETSVLHSTGLFLQGEENS